MAKMHLLLIVFSVLVIGCSAQNSVSSEIDPNDLQNRDKRTIGAILGGVADLFGYDLQRRPSQVAADTGPVSARQMAPPAAPPAAPAAPPAAAGGMPSLPATLTDGVRRAFQLGVNWSNQRQQLGGAAPPAAPAPPAPAAAAPAPAAPAPAAPAPAPAAPPAPQGFRQAYTVGFNWQNLRQQLGGAPAPAAAPAAPAPAAPAPAAAAPPAPQGFRQSYLVGLDFSNQRQQLGGPPPPAAAPAAAPPPPAAALPPPTPPAGIANLAQVPRRVPELLRSKPTLVERIYFDQNHPKTIDLTTMTLKQSTNNNDDAPVIHHLDIPPSREQREEENEEEETNDNDEDDTVVKQLPRGFEKSSSTDNDSDGKEETYILNEDYSYENKLMDSPQKRDSDTTMEKVHSTSAVKHRSVRSLPLPPADVARAIHNNLIGYYSRKFLNDAIRAHANLPSHLVKEPYDFIKQEVNIPEVHSRVLHNIQKQFEKNAKENKKAAAGDNLDGRNGKIDRYHSEVLGGIQSGFAKSAIDKLTNEDHLANQHQRILEKIREKNENEDGGAIDEGEEVDVAKEELEEEGNDIAKANNGEEPKDEEGAIEPESVDKKEEVDIAKTNKNEKEDVNEPKNVDKEDEDEIVKVGNASVVGTEDEAIDADAEEDDEEKENIEKTTEENVQLVEEEEDGEDDETGKLNNLNDKRVGIENTKVADGEGEEEEDTENNENDEEDHGKEAPNKLIQKLVEAVRNDKGEEKSDKNESANKSIEAEDSEDKENDDSEEESEDSATKNNAIDKESFKNGTASAKLDKVENAEEEEDTQEKVNAEEDAEEEEGEAKEEEEEGEAKEEEDEESHENDKTIKPAEEITQKPLSPSVQEANEKTLKKYINEHFEVDEIDGLSVPIGVKDTDHYKKILENFDKPFEDHFKFFDNNQVEFEPQKKQEEDDGEIVEEDEDADDKSNENDEDDKKEENEVVEDDDNEETDKADNEETKNEECKEPPLHYPHEEKQQKIYTDFRHQKLATQDSNLLETVAHLPEQLHSGGFGMAKPLKLQPVPFDFDYDVSQTQLSVKSTPIDRSLVQLLNTQSTPFTIDSIHSTPSTIDNIHSTPSTIDSIHSTTPSTISKGRSKRDTIEWDYKQSWPTRRNKRQIKWTYKPDRYDPSLADFEMPEPTKYKPIKLEKIIEEPLSSKAVITESESGRKKTYVKVNRRIKESY